MNCIPPVAAATVAVLTSNFPGFGAMRISSEWWYTYFTFNYVTITPCYKSQVTDISKPQPTCHVTRPSATTVQMSIKDPVATSGQFAGRYRQQGSNNVAAAAPSASFKYRHEHMVSLEQGHGS
jgi:hypothetical protein